ncbi:cytochrome c [Deinococcus sp. YIM 77859]|uniref:c-type cytochrome n=1 Tax=Deinococcus sp. YIM 77859 TaxID=1540221 RepID=UPI000553C033|nr:c-type cytochrome [Deinococcus sp. YIM 77859]
MKRTARRLLWLAAPLALAAPVIAAVTQAGSPSGPSPAGNPLELKYHTPSAARGAQIAASSCQGCHGPSGVSTDPTVPRLAGQVPSYVRLQLAAFRAKLRPSPVMQRVAANLKDQDIADLAAYFAARPPGPAWTTDPALRARGEALFQRGDAARNVIACAICHGAHGRGEDSRGIASVTNMSPGYALKVLHEFKETPSFGGIPHPEAMRIALQPLQDADLRALAAYISSMQ